jgi:hypothetical protein
VSEAAAEPPKRATAPKKTTVPKKAAAPAPKKAAAPAPKKAAAPAPKKAAAQPPNKTVRRPYGMNLYDFLSIVTESEEQTDRFVRIVDRFVILIVLIVALVSIREGSRRYRLGLWLRAEYCGLEAGP